MYIIFIIFNLIHIYICKYLYLCVKVYIGVCRVERKKNKRRRLLSGNFFEEGGLRKCVIGKREIHMRENILGLLPRDWELLISAELIQISFIGPDGKSMWEKWLGILKKEGDRGKEFLWIKETQTANGSLQSNSCPPERKALYFLPEEKRKEENKRDQRLVRIHGYPRIIE